MFFKEKIEKCEKQRPERTNFLWKQDQGAHNYGFLFSKGINVKNKEEKAKKKVIRKFLRKF